MALNETLTNLESIYDDLIKLSEYLESIDRSNTEFDLKLNGEILRVDNIVDTLVSSIILLEDEDV